ncbi:MAG: flagellar export chaperone FliS [Smithellaceae bacterium]
MHGNSYSAEKEVKEITDNYQRMEIMTADPKRLIVLCYNRAISALKLAIDHYEARDFEAKAQDIQKAQDIISALRTALDFKNGGEVAVNLDALYSFMTRHIIEADLKKDINALKSIVNMLEEIESAWKEIFYGNHNENVVYPNALRTTIKEAPAENQGWIG